MAKSADWRCRRGRHGWAATIIGPMPLGRVYCTRRGCQAFLTVEDWRHGRRRWQIDGDVTVIEGATWRPHG